MESVSRQLTEDNVVNLNLKYGFLCKTRNSRLRRYDIEKGQASIQDIINEFIRNILYTDNLNKYARFKMSKVNK